jgi:hypothetical protein
MRKTLILLALLLNIIPFIENDMFTIGIPAVYAQSMGEENWQELEGVTVTGYVPSEDFQYPVFNTPITEPDYAGNNNESLYDDLNQTEVNQNPTIPDALTSMDGKADVSKMMNCFESMLKGTGTTYSATIYVDIPNNDDPASTWNWQEFSPGHTFISLTAANNGGTIVTQTFGFYPDCGPCSIACLPVDSYTKNDGRLGIEHEYNASLTMTDLNAIQFQTMINTAIEKSKKSYDLDDYNCTSFALDVINSARPVYNPLISTATVDVPGISPSPPFFSDHSVLESPSGLYKTLKDMKSAGNPEANKIQVNVNSRAGTSKGECP